MNYTKQESLGGKFVKGSEIKSGVRCKLVSETKPVQSQFKNEDGTPKIQDIAKVVFEDDPKETLIISINRTSINGLIDAFGEDSKLWQGNYLTVITEKVRVAGKAVTSVYLVPEGYEKIDDADGYARIIKKETEEVIVPDEKEEDLSF